MAEDGLSLNKEGWRKQWGLCEVTYGRIWEADYSSAWNDRGWNDCIRCIPQHGYSITQPVVTRKWWIFKKWVLSILQNELCWKRKLEFWLSAPSHLTMCSLPIFCVVPSLSCELSPKAEQLRSQKFTLGPTFHNQSSSLGYYSKWKKSKYHNFYPWKKKIKKRLKLLLGKKQQSLTWVRRRGFMVTFALWPVSSFCLGLSVPKLPFFLMLCYRMMPNRKAVSPSCNYKSCSNPLLYLVPSLSPSLLPSLVSSLHSSSLSLLHLFNE